jgi:hypothetical protein
MRHFLSAAQHDIRIFRTHSFSLHFYDYFQLTSYFLPPYHPFYFQTNFLITQGLALFLASFFRSYLHPSKVSASARHAFGLLIGLFFGYFCFGHQAIHIAGLPAVCYIVMLTQNPLFVQR